MLESNQIQKYSNVAWGQHNLPPEKKGFILLNFFVKQTRRGANFKIFPDLGWIFFFKLPSLTAWWLLNIEKNFEASNPFTQVRNVLIRDQGPLTVRLRFFRFIFSSPHQQRVNFIKAANEVRSDLF